MKVSLLFPLVVLVSSSLIAQNITRDAEEEFDLSVLEISQESASGNSPIMMFGRVEREGESRFENEHENSRSTIQSREKGEKPRIKVDAFKRIIESEYIADDALIGHTTGYDGGSYNGFKNNLFCLSDYVPGFLKDCSTPEEQKQQIKAASRKMKEDLGKASKESLGYNVPIFRATGRIDNRLTSDFKKFITNHQKGITKAELRQFCVQNNIIISEEEPLVEANEESFLIQNNNGSNQGLSQVSRNYGSGQKTQAAQVEELRSFLEFFKTEPALIGWSDIDRYKAFRQKISSDLSLETTHLVEELEERLPYHIATRENSWIFESLMLNRPIISLEKAIKKTEETMKLERVEIEPGSFKANSYKVLILEGKNSKKLQKQQRENSCIIQ